MMRKRAFIGEGTRVGMGAGYRRGFRLECWRGDLQRVGAIANRWQPARGWTGSEIWLRRADWLESRVSLIALLPKRARVARARPLSMPAARAASSKTNPAACKKKLFVAAREDRLGDAAEQIDVKPGSKAGTRNQRR